MCTREQCAYGLSDSVRWGLPLGSLCEFSPCVVGERVVCVLCLCICCVSRAVCCLWTHGHASTSEGCCAGRCSLDCVRVVLYYYYYY